MLLNDIKNVMQFINKSKSVPIHQDEPYSG